MAKAFGWLLHAHRAAHQDVDGEGAAFSVNLVMPWGNAAQGRYPGQVSPDDVEHPAAWLRRIDDPEPMAPGLFMPWTWQWPNGQPQWQAYARVGENDWQRCPHLSVQESLGEAADVLQRMRDAASADLQHMSGTHPRPFSTLEEDWDLQLDGRTQQSLAHRLAGMTHQPALLSAEVLRMTWLLRVGELPEGATGVVFLPAFALGALAVEPVVNGSKLVALENDSTLSCQMGATSDAACSIIFASNIAAIAADAAGPVAAIPVKISSHALSRATIEGVIAQRLAPACLLEQALARYAEDCVDDRGTFTVAQARSAFLALLGRGFELGEPDSQGLPHVLEFLPQTGVLAGTWRATLAQAQLDPLALLDEFCRQLEQCGGFDDEVLRYRALQSNDLTALMAACLKGAAQEPNTAYWKAWLVAVLAQGCKQSPDELRQVLFGAEKIPDGDWPARLVMGQWSVLSVDPAHEQLDDAGGGALADELLGALSAAITSPLGPRLHDALAETVAGAVLRMNQQCNAMRGQPGVDPVLKFSPTMQAASMPDASVLRGVAPCVQAGLPKQAGEVSWGKAAWVAQYAIAVDADCISTLPAQHVLRMDMQNGRRVADYGYAGRPYFGTSSSMNDETSPFACHWREDWALPGLGYGLVYRAAFVPLDNIGAPMVAGLSPQHYPPRFEDAAGFLQTLGPPASGPYLSRMRPAAVPLQVAAVPGDYSLASLSELGAQTRAAAMMANDPRWSEGRRQVHVLLTPGSGEWYWPQATGADISLSRPRVSALFYERWVYAELACLHCGLAQGHRAGFNADALERELALARTSTALPGTASEPEASFAHPAVTALGIRVTFDGAAELPRTRILALNGDAPATLAVRGSLGAVPEFADDHTVHLPQGRYAVIEVYSLIKSSWFTDPVLRRFDLAMQGDLQGINDEYVWFGPVRVVFETVPDLVSGGSKPLTVPVKVHEDGNRVSVLTQTACLPRDIYRIETVRHLPQWSGLPVRFPDNSASDSALADWLLSMTGAATTPIEGDYVLPEALLLSDQPLAAGTKVFTEELPAERGAYLMAFVVRPVPRFAAWLRPQAVKAQASAALGLVPGTFPLRLDGRLPAPVLNAALPLTLTLAMDAEAQAPVRAPNGNLLVFDDVLLRTDSLARHGGVGERICVDLEETREAGGRQVGVNPIAHALAPHKNLDVTLTLGLPFGLTHDLGLNALPVQSAVIVTPEVKDQGGQSVPGRWLMAKVRCRRMVLPETLVQPPKLKTLRVRSTEQGWVPYDFCLDLERAIGDTLRVQLESGGPSPVKHELTLSLPGFSAAAGTVWRYLITWHWGRWPDAKGGNGEPGWRPQVRLQRKRSAFLEWDDLATTSCWQQGVAAQLPDPWRLAATQPEAACKDGKLAGAVQYPQVSDYTESQWLQFIGSFGQALAMPGEFRLAKTSERVQLQERDGVQWKPSQIQLFGPEVLTPAPLPGEKPTTEDMARLQPTAFQLLLVLRPIVDIVRGGANPDSGALVAVMAPVPAGKKPTSCEFGAFGAQAIEARAGDRAYIVTFRYRNVSKSFTPPANWDEVWKGMFCEEKEEASLRMEPEFLGPLDIIEN